MDLSENLEKKGWNIWVIGTQVENHWTMTKKKFTEI